MPTSRCGSRGRSIRPLYACCRPWPCAGFDPAGNRGSNVRPDRRSIPSHKPRSNPRQLVWRSSHRAFGFEARFRSGSFRRFGFGFGSFSFWFSSLRSPSTARRILPNRSAAAAVSWYVVKLFVTRIGGGSSTGFRLRLICDLPQQRNLWFQYFEGFPCQKSTRLVVLGAMRVYLPPFAFRIDVRDPVHP